MEIYLHVHYTPWSGASTWRKLCHNNVISEGFTEAGMILMFWVLEPCKFAGRYQRFGATYYLHFQG